ncbi:uncharacterized protein LOC125231234 isoform X2 [Leguminivora glycinivorella]|uniref:uncharacterized protein LOC125231234 isoform X2 n=1 Tax=Leguminivora glycinivorella TaxID=1035111 RepID=UPI00200D1D59|nr:uncharacterized protein LOC125231234 isoform X2 [Leguminivora glycinivorella]
MEVLLEKPDPVRSEIVVRNACTDDVSDVYDIIKLEIPDVNYPPLKDFTRDGFETSPPWFHVLVAERDRNILGCALYYHYYWARPSPPGRALVLRMICVRKSVRRCGVGTKLFRELCRVAVKENAQLNWTHPAGDPAAAFFAQFNPDFSEDFDGTYGLRINPKTVREIAASKLHKNNDISIQLARKEDMAELSKMIHEISVIRETLYGRHLKEKDLIEDGFTSSPWFFALIARREGSVVGTAVGSRLYWERSLDMQSLYVRPEARRCGLAKLLIVQFCRKAEEEGIEHVDFHVHPINTEASALYDSFGAQKLFDDHGSFRLEVDKIEQILAEK